MVAPSSRRPPPVIGIFMDGNNVIQAGIVAAAPIDQHGVAVADDQYLVCLSYVNEVHLKTFCAENSPGSKSRNADRTESQELFHSLCSFLSKVLILFGCFCYSILRGNINVTGDVSRQIKDERGGFCQINDAF